MKTYTCRDVGVDCDWKVRGNDEAEVMRKISDHARAVHKIDPIPPDLERKTADTDLVERLREVEARLAELDKLHDVEARLAELEERLDFAERALVDVRTRAQLPPKA